MLPARTALARWTYTVTADVVVVGWQVLNVSHPTHRPGPKCASSRFRGAPGQPKGLCRAASPLRLSNPNSRLRHHRTPTPAARMAGSSRLMPIDLRRRGPSTRHSVAARRSPKVDACSVSLCGQPYPSRAELSQWWPALHADGPSMFSRTDGRRRDRRAVLRSGRPHASPHQVRRPTAAAEYWRARLRRCVPYSCSSIAKWSQKVARVNAMGVLVSVNTRTQNPTLTPNGGLPGTRHLLISAVRPFPGVAGHQIGSACRW